MSEIMWFYYFIFLLSRGHIFPGRKMCRFLCEPNEGNTGYKGEKNKPSAQVGREAEEKHQGGQTAMKSLMLPASVEIGPANCPNPEQVLIPPK